MLMYKLVFADGHAYTEFTKFEDIFGWIDVMVQEHGTWTECYVHSVLSNSWDKVF